MIFPEVLPMLYSSLQNVTDTHRTSASIALMVLLIPVLLKNGHYKKGPLHLIDMLEITIPGIDLNDEEKSHLTCLFIGYAITNVPLVDTSDSETNLTSDQMEVDGPEPEPKRSLNQSNTQKQIRQKTKRFEQWLIGFLENLFAMFKNLPEGVSMTGHNSLIGSISILLEKIYNQLSPALEDKVLEILLLNIKDINAICIEPVAVVLGSFSSRNPSKRLGFYN
jgi:proteasome activator subunit 4